MIVAHCHHLPEKGLQLGQRLLRNPFLGEILFGVNPKVFYGSIDC